MGSKIANRLQYYLSRTKPPPRIFVTMHDTIPLLVTTFEEVKDACNDGNLDSESQKRLTKNVEGCHRFVAALEDYLQECLPVEGCSFAQKKKKAICEIQRNLEA